VIDSRDADTLWHLFRERVRRSPEAIAYRDYDPGSSRWRDHDWRTIADRVDCFRAALAREPLRPGDRVAILVPNGIDWVCLDVAAHACGLVVVALYPHEAAASNSYILSHSDARLILLDTEARWQALARFHAQFPALERVWIREQPAGAQTEAGAPVVRGLADVLAGTDAPPPEHPAAPGDLATLIYTSGTTGQPKGVMLSHFALLWNAEATAHIVPPLRSDVFLSVLPLAHAFERTVGYYLPMMGGCAIAYARSPQDLPEDLKILRPTVLLGVPLLYERVAASIRARTATSIIKKSLLRLTTAVGWRRFEAAMHRGSAGIVVRLLWPLLKRLVAGPVLAAFGGRLRIAVSGGAPLDRDVSRLLVGVGLPLVEGYGLTETAPVVAANSLDDNLLGSVGRPLQGVDVKLGRDSELLVRSPAMMAGYWKAEHETGKALDADGWLATGDAGAIKDGRVFLTGRLSDMIVLSIGETINPNVVETEIIRDPLFAQAYVSGDGRPYLVAVVVLDDAEWRCFAADNGLDPERPNQTPGKAQVLARIAAALADLARHAQVRAVHLTLQPWTIADGLLTPTLKIKRAPVGRLFSKEIQDLYAEEMEPSLPSTA
jgi:long-chain acyl-CoA synthetase